MPGIPATRHPRIRQGYHARNIRDEDEIISFGLFDMNRDDYHRWREEDDAAENQVWTTIGIRRERTRVRRLRGDRNLEP